MHGPTIYSLPSHSSFDEALARGLSGRYGRDSSSFARGLILVQSSGVKQLMADAFKRARGDNLALPSIISLGSDEPEAALISLLDGQTSIQDLPPAVDELHRRMALFDLMRAAGAPVDNCEAFRLAGAIAKAIDDVLDSELSLAQISQYLAIEAPPLPLWLAADLVGPLMEGWERELSRLGMIDAKVRRARILEQLSRQWRERPPSHFICAADIADSGPSITRLLRTIADLPKGSVVLSGLSLMMDHDQWDALITPRQRLSCRPDLQLPDWPSFQNASRTTRPTYSAFRPDNIEQAKPGAKSSTKSRSSGKAAASARSRKASAGDNAMRFQANSPNTHGWDADEYDVWLSGQPKFQDFPNAKDGVPAFEDDWGDHPNVWADEGEDFGDLAPWDTGDDPTENHEEFDDEYYPGDWTAPSYAMHPQYHLKELLHGMGVAREEVQPWHRSSAWRSSPARSRAIDTAFALPGACASWQDLPSNVKNLAGIRAFEAPSPQLEAFAVASALRDAQASPDMTAALFTPDRELARRVIAICNSWEIPVDDFVGEPLSMLPVGSLLLAIIHAAIAPTPASLLTLIHHPLIRSTRDPDCWLAVIGALRTAEKEAAPLATTSDLEGLLKGHAVPHNAEQMLEHLICVLRPFEPTLAKAMQSISDLVIELCRAAEALVGPTLWDDEPGRAARDLLEALHMHSRQIRMSVDVASLKAMLRGLLDEKSIPSRGVRPARIIRLGLDEARVHTPALVVIAGLNERHWPSEPGADPWLSARVRHDAYLPSSFDPIGRQMHAMAQALGAPQVLLTRSKIDNHAWQKPSQAWMRLDALNRGGLKRAREFEDAPSGLAIQVPISSGTSTSKTYPKARTNG